MRRIHQFTRGYVNNEIRHNTSTVCTNLYMRHKKYRMNKNSWNKFAIITGAQLLRFFPHPKNNVRRLYPEFFPNFNFCKFGNERTARYVPKGNTVLSALRNFR